MKILFVCTGNTCRSPMAEKILAKKAKELNLDIEVKSAGIAAIEGQSASKHAREMMKENGDDQHTTTKTNKELLSWADLILTMTYSHKQMLMDQDLNIHDKIYTLKEFASKGSAVSNDLDQLNQLNSQIEKKKQEFLEKNKEQIKILEERYKTLKEELVQVELEMNEFKRMLQEDIREEMQEMKRIENNLPSLDINDPFGGDLETYRNTAIEIEKAIDQFVIAGFLK